MSTALCTGPCRPDAHGGPRRAMPGYSICDICEERCWENLHWLADHWPDLEVMLTAGSRGPDGMPHAKSEVTGISINETVAELRRTITDTLRYWTHVILDENAGFTGTKDDAVSMARYVAGHSRRITRHHDEALAAALPIDANDMRRQMYRRAFPSGARLYVPEPEIPCAEHAVSDLGERVPCTGIYRAWITDQTDGVPDLLCSEDEEHVLTPEGFRRTGRRVIKTAAAMALVRAIAG